MYTAWWISSLIHQIEPPRSRPWAQDKCTQHGRNNKARYFDKENPRSNSVWGGGVRIVCGGDKSTENRYFLPFFQGILIQPPTQPQSYFILIFFSHKIIILFNTYIQLSNEKCSAPNSDNKRIYGVVELKEIKTTKQQKQKRSESSATEDNVTY